MAETFTYEIGGIPTDDEFGRWRLAEASRTLPSMGSLSVTKYRAPGQQGETQAVLAPRDPQEFPIQVIFYPVEAGVKGRTKCERVAILTRHIDLFQQATRLSAQESLGLIRLKKSYSGATPDRITAARITSDSIDLKPGAQEAVMTLLVSIPSGVWHEPGYTVRQWQAPGVSGGSGWLWGEFPVGPAGVANLQFAVRGRQNGKSSGHSIWVKNEADTGFIARVDVPANRWLIVNCSTWAYTILPDLNWGAGKKSTAGLLGWGRGTGNALTLFPSATLGVGRVGFRMPNAGTVALRGRKAYY